MDEKDLNETLSIEQRRKRAQIMRAHHTQIERARELAQRKLAGEKNIRKRAFQLARSIMRKKLAGERGAEYAKLGPSEKVSIDKMLDSKVKAIKKLAQRLIPKVKKSEYERLKSYIHGKQINNLGAEEGHQMKEDINDLFNEAFSFPQDPNRPNLAGSPNSTMNSGLGKPKVASNGAKKSKNSNIEFHEPFGTSKTNKIAESLSRKSEESGVDFDVLAEVFTRGLDSYPETAKVTREQYAFARVNSYINQGKTYFNEDADLHEMGGDQHYGDSKGATSGGAKGTPISKKKMNNDASETLNRMFQKSIMKNEDMDLHELSSATLDSYAKKSNKQAVGLVRKIGDINNKKYANRTNAQQLNKLGSEDQTEKSATLAKLKQRKLGQALAVKKLDRMNEEDDLHEATEKHFYVTYNSMTKGKQLLHKKNKPFTSIADAKDHIDKIAPGHPNRASLGRIHTVDKDTGRIIRVTNYDTHQAGYPYSPSLGDAKSVKDLHEAAPAKRKRLRAKDLLNKAWVAHTASLDAPKKAVNEDTDLDEEKTVKACWKGYKAVGFKQKNGKRVPNCVPEQVEVETTESSKNSKARKKIEKVDRAAPHTELGKQGEIITKIIEAKKLGNKVNDPAKRLQGTDSLDKAYRGDTPGEGINESFNIAFAAGVGVTLTAKDLGIQAQSGFAHHPSVVAEMAAIEEDMYAADRKPVYVPAHKSESGATIPAKTVLRRTRKKIVGSGGTHDGK